MTSPLRSPAPGEDTPTQRNGYLSSETYLLVRQLDSESKHRESHDEEDYRPSNPQWRRRASILACNMVTPQGQEDLGQVQMRNRRNRGRVASLVQTLEIPLKRDRHSSVVEVPSRKVERRKSVIGNEGATERRLSLDSTLSEIKSGMVSSRLRIFRDGVPRETIEEENLSQTALVTLTVRQEADQPPENKTITVLHSNRDGMADQLVLLPIFLLIFQIFDFKYQPDNYVA